MRVRYSKKVQDFLRNQKNGYSLVRTIAENGYEVIILGNTIEVPIDDQNIKVTISAARNR